RGLCCRDLFRLVRIMTGTAGREQRDHAPGMEASIHPCHDFPPERARRRSSESSSPDFLREDNASRVPDGVGHEPSGTLDADFTAAEAHRRTSSCGILEWIGRVSRTPRTARSTTARAGVALGEVSHTALSRFRTYYRSA